MLKIQNEFGNFDVVHVTVPKGYQLVKGDRLQPICRRLRIQFVPAVTRWIYSGYSKYGSKPVIGGVIVTAKSAPKLLHAIDERIAKRADPKAIARRRRAAERRKEKREEWETTVREHGIHDPEGRTAKALKRGEIDSFEARLIAFKTRYRHEFTDYEIHLAEIKDIDRNDFPSYDAFRSAKEFAYEDARMSRQDYSIPDNWPDYLHKYGFTGPIADAMASVLADPRKCHPVWFCACMLGLEEDKTDLTALTYERIRDAKLTLDVLR